MKESDESGKLKKLLETINVNVSRLYHIATHGEKTGLYNHVFFKDVFSFELEKARRGKPLSLVVIDIDFFKRVNDTYGHLRADKILMKLANILKEEVRKYDVAARFGGEEFFVMLPNTALNRAKMIAERLRKAILSDSFLKKYHITISAGVAEYKERDNFEKIGKRADKALYLAKKTGRNRVCA
jgi:two-component system, cell cycle response regulator